MPMHESMPDPRTGHGDYCAECFCEMDDEFKAEKLAAFCLTKLSGQDKYLTLFGKDPQKLVGNCHYAARETVKALNAVLPKEAGAILRRGFWLGQGGVGQHSWVDVWRENERCIIDPTQFKFTKGMPQFDYAQLEDERYDLCGFALQGNRLNGYKPLHESPVFEIPKPFRPAAKAALGLKVLPRKIGMQTLNVLVKSPQSTWENPRDFFKAVINQGQAVLVPREWRIYYGLVPDPDVDINTRPCPFDPR